MKVCFFAHYSVSNRDGASLSMYNIVDNMIARGIEVIVVIPNAKNQNYLKNDKAKYLVVPMFGMRMPIHKSKWILNIKFCIKNIYNRIQTYKLARILRTENIDIIHINGLDTDTGATVARALKIPYVWHVRQFMEEDLGKRLFNQKHLYRLVKKSDAIIGISNGVKRHFEHIFQRKIRLIYNGIPINKYLISDNEIFVESTVKILLAGRISIQKGQMIAIKAVEILLGKGFHNVVLTLVGVGETEEYRNKVASYIIEHHLENNIHLLNATDDLHLLRKSHDIGLTCSQKEAFGRVTVENMMAGLLVIGSNTGGTREIIKDHKNGLLYKVDNPEDLCDRIVEAITNPNEMRKLAKVGREESINSYSIDRVVDQILDLYREILE